MRLKGGQQPQQDAIDAVLALGRRGLPAVGDITCALYVMFVGPLRNWGVDSRFLAM
jgi:hypothetical protein